MERSGEREVGVLRDGRRGADRRTRQDIVAGVRRSREGELRRRASGLERADARAGDRADDELASLRGGTLVAALRLREILAVVDAEIEDVVARDRKTTRLNPS